MDILYTINLSPHSIKSNRLPCSLSIKNVFAYSIDFSIYAIPLEKPNEVIEVAELKNECVFLQWSDDGLCLLSVLKDGTCMLHSINDFILNQFSLLYTYQVTLNDTICTKWLNKCQRVHFNIDNKEAFNYYEKFQFISYSVVKTTRNKSNNGFILLNKTGIVYLFITDFNSVKNEIENFEFKLQDLGNEQTTTTSIDLADYQYDQCENVILAYTNYDIQSLVYVYNIRFEVNQNSGTLEMISTLKSTINVQYENMLTKTHLVFPLTNNSSYLFVALSNEQSQLIQIWQQIYEVDMNQWNLINIITCPSNITQISSPKMTLDPQELNHLEMNNGYLTVSYSNGLIGLVDRLTFNQTLTDILLNELINNKQTIKKFKSETPYFIALEQSFGGCVSVGITNTNQLVVFMPQLQSNNLNYYVNLLELFMISGIDYWEILVGLKSRTSEGLIERLEENYRQQSYNSIRKSYQTSFHKLLHNVYFQSTNLQFKSVDYLIRLQLNRSISITTFSLHLIIKTNETTLALSDYLNDLLILKPLSTQELMKINLNEIIQLILNYKVNQISLSQQIKHVLQWSIDLCIYLISIIADSNQILRINQLNSLPIQIGVSLLNDAEFLNDLRKAIIYSKLLFSSLQAPSNLTPNQSSSFVQNPTINPIVGLSLPVLPFKTNTNRDYLSDLFLIITKLINHKLIEYQQGNSIALDDVLLDQCNTIKAEAVVRPMDEYFYSMRQPWIHQNVKDAYLKLNVDCLFQDEKQIKNYPLFDVIKLITFSRSQYTRQCVKCGNYSEFTNGTNNDSSKQNCTFIQETASNGCICGGLWVFSSSS